MADFKKLLVWRKAHELNLQISGVAGDIRGAQYLSLRSQMVRAALSIPANIVEGRGQKSDAQFARFLNIAINSSSELEYHLLTARDLQRISKELHDTLLANLIEVRRMLYGLLSTVNSPAARENRR